MLINRLHDPIRQSWYTILFSSVLCISFLPDVLDASRWPDVFKVLLTLVCSNRYNSDDDSDSVRQACLRCISQSFEIGMISRYT